MGFQDVFKKSFLEGFNGMDITTGKIAATLFVTAILALYVFKGRLVPLLAVFLSCLVPNLLRLLLFPEPGGLAAFLVALLSLVSLLYLYCFIRFGALLWRYWRSVRR